jgi:hypothetical protein
MGGTRYMGCVGLFALATLLVASCGGTSDEGFALQARGGAYVDGTGRLGLALLATVRDGDGLGPAAEWSGSLSGPLGPVGAGATYWSPGAGSWFATLWPEEPGYAGLYTLELASAGGGALTAAFELSDGTGIAPPQPAASEDGSSLSWPAVPGAASYECVVHGETGPTARALGSATTCDLSGLPAGAWTASVFAYSADLTAISASGSRTPALPDRFDVSEARLALTRSDGSAPAAALAAVGGGFHDGTSWPGRGLAVWVSILNGDGTATTVPWTIEVVGPGFPAGAPLTFTYPANFSRLMVWSAAVPAVPGSYGLVARSAAGNLARAFTLGAFPTLDAPMGVVASARAQGAADVEWSPVIGATSYLVTARDASSGEYVSSQWVAGTTAGFPASTFVADRSYTVRVAATDADMVGGSPPERFGITENSYQPASFVGR